LDQGPGGALQGDREERPARDPGEEIQPVVRDPAALVEDDPEDDQVDDENGERVDERPHDPERRPAVLGGEVAPAAGGEQVAVPDEGGVHGHGSSVRTRYEGFAPAAWAGSVLTTC